MPKKSPKPPGGVPFQSKLVPYEDQIRQWMRRGLSYAAMATLLKEEHGMIVHPDTINSFVLVRARGRRRAVLPDPLPPAKSPQPPAERPGRGARKAPDRYPPADVDKL